MLIGVMSSPAHEARRQAIRQSWMRWVRDASSVDACFAVGTHNLTEHESRALWDEVKLEADLMLMRSVDDGGTKAVTIDKAYEWWRLAASMLQRNTALRYVAKVDDDSFVHIPRLLMTAQLGIGCDEFIYFGAMALTGYVATQFAKCGFSWLSASNGSQYPGAENWYRHRCSAHGAHPPFPFAVGQLELLSSSLVRRLAADEAFADFSNSAKAKAAQDEDVALGFAVHQLHLTGLHVSYVDSQGDASPFRMHNLGCRPAGLYQPPSDASLVVHRVTSPAAMLYIWRVLHDGAAHVPAECLRAMSVSVVPP